MKGRLPRIEMALFTRIFGLFEQAAALRRLAVGFAMAALFTAPAAARQAPADASASTLRAPLLREGSTLVEARAQLHRVSNQDWWTLTLDADSPGITSMGTAPAGAQPLHELIVLPCSRLMEMERILASAPEGQPSSIRFEVSGRVYVFHDRNYFLPTHAAVISTIPPSPPPPAPPASAASAPDAGMPNSATATTPEDDSAEAIARVLQQQAGPLARSSGAARQESPVNDVPTSQVEGDAGAGQIAPLHENAAVVNRRGKVTRDRSGGWLMVFDADATGLADPPMKLLPCELLEKIEDYARRNGHNSPIIVTGQVHLYAGQSHLLPTVYRVPRESSRLTP